MAEDMIDVKYTSNADPRSLSSVVVLEGRKDMPLGGVGKVTSDEFARLTERGVMLEVLTKSQAKKAVGEAEPVEPPAAGGPAPASTK